MFGGGYRGVWAGWAEEQQAWRREGDGGLGTWGRGSGRRRLQCRLDVEAVAEEDGWKSHPKGSCWDLIS